MIYKPKTPVSEPVVEEHVTPGEPVEVTPEAEPPKKERKRKEKPPKEVK